MVSKEEALRELNLSEKEIKVYIASLMLGQSSVNEIAQKANLNRVTTYDILKSLEEKGFTSYVIKSGVKYFEAVDPSKFLSSLKEKQEKIKQVMPELLAIKTILTEKPSIEFFEGIEGLKSIFNDVLQTNKETCFVGAPKMLSVLEFYFPHFVKQKRKQRIFSRVITTDCKEMHEYKKKAPRKYLEMRFLKDKIETTKIIYSNKIAFLTFEEKNSIGVLIKNKQIVELEKNLFNLIWKYPLAS